MLKIAVTSCQEQTILTRSTSSLRQPVYVAPAGTAISASMDVGGIVDAAQEEIPIPALSMAVVQIISWSPMRFSCTDTPRTR